MWQVVSGIGVLQVIETTERENPADYCSLRAVIGDSGTGAQAKDQNADLFIARTSTTSGA
jgi:hypothetical protein